MPTARQNNLILITLKFVFIDIIGDFLYWPVWWYTVGLKKVVWYVMSEIKSFEHRLGLSLWARSMFKPMFGQSDWQGRLISFFMRTLVLMWRLVSFCLWSALLIVFLIFWCIVLPYCVYQVLRNTGII